jgi:dTDP-4-amino-4,6-dideoxygalactose transaminase
MSFIAPAGTPLTIADLARGLSQGRSSAAIDGLRERLCRIAGRDRAWLFSTGRAAMVVAFEAMKRVAADPRRVEVIMPGYTCYSVPAAAERAGLVPRLCDVDPTTLDADLDSLAGVDLSRVLAIVSANLYGLPNSLSEIEAFARRNGIFMLDDAAQALGARMVGRAAGGFGDLGLYSFDKGKNITTLQGGALVARDGPLADTIADIAEALPGPNELGTLSSIAKLLAYSLLLRPVPYGFVRRLPLGLGLTPYETDYPIQAYDSSLGGLAALQLNRLDRINGTRVQNAETLADALAGCSEVVPVAPLDGSEPVYARFPVMAGAQSRAALIERLEAAGIGATASYPSALIDVPEVARRLGDDQRPTPGAREVARRIVTLPTHAYSPRGFGERIRRTTEQLPPSV